MSRQKQTVEWNFSGKTVKKCQNLSETLDLKVYDMEALQPNPGVAAILRSTVAMVNKSVKATALCETQLKLKSFPHFQGDILIPYSFP